MLLLLSPVCLKKQPVWRMCECSSTWKKEVLSLFLKEVTVNQFTESEQTDEKEIVTYLKGWSLIIISTTQYFLNSIFFIILANNEASFSSACHLSEEPFRFHFAVYNPASLLSPLPNIFILTFAVVIGLPSGHCGNWCTQLLTNTRVLMDSVVLQKNTCLDFLVNLSQFRQNVQWRYCYNIYIYIYVS